MRVFKTQLKTLLGPAPNPEDLGTYVVHKCSNRSTHGGFSAENRRSRKGKELFRSRSEKVAREWINNYMISRAAQTFLELRWEPDVPSTIVIPDIQYSSQKYVFDDDEYYSRKMSPGDLKGIN